MADNNQEQDNAIRGANQHDLAAAEGVRRARPKRLGGPLTGAALAAILALAVVIALVVIPRVTPTASVGQKASSASPSPTRTTMAAVPPIAFVGGTTHDAITISWRRPRSLPVGYRIYRATGRFAPYMLVGTVNEPDLTSFTDATDLSHAATYVYQVRSFDGQKESAPSSPVVAVLLPGLAPTVSPTATAQPIGPLPTFAQVAPATLTVIARLPRSTGTPSAAPGASTTPGLAIPVTSSTPGLAIPVTSPTVGAAILTPGAGAPTVAP